jgi:hypothetical protein
VSTWKSLLNRRSYRKHRQKRLAYSKKRRADFPDKAKESDRKSRIKLKTEVVEAYGGKCSCCGETELVFLTIEHINHDGKKHQLEVGPGHGIYRDLKRRGFPKHGYTVFCWNCQMATRFGKPCPHTRKDKNERSSGTSTGIEPVVASN